MQNPVLPNKRYTADPKNEADERAGRERKTPDATYPFFHGAAAGGHGVANALEDGQRALLLRHQVAQPKGGKRAENKNEPVQLRYRL